MPDELSRTTARKTVVLPSGDKIRVPVIIKIAFVDPYDRYQETEHGLDNTEQSNRIVHVDQVHAVDVDADGVPTEETPTADAASLYVERIDTWKALDPYERYQETQLTLDNATGNDQLPPHFSEHAKTHIYRYHQDPQNPDDEGVWIDSELIDEFTVVDPYERYQEKHYTLTNPTNAEFRDGDLSGQVSADDPDITIGDGSGEGTETNPVRLDPFQNIVNYNGGQWISVGFFVTSADFGTTSIGAVTPIPRAKAVTTDYMSSWLTALSFDGTIGNLLDSNGGSTAITEGLTWSYSGGGTDTQTPTPFSFLKGTGLSGQTTFGVRCWGPAENPGGFTSYLDYGNTGIGFPFFTPLSLPVRVFGYSADGPWLNGVISVVQAFTPIQSDLTVPENIFSLGDLIQTRTFNFSSIVATYHGVSYEAVALTATGTFITVLLKKAA